MKPQKPEGFPDKSTLLGHWPMVRITQVIHFSVSIFIMVQCWYNFETTVQFENLSCDTDPKPGLEFLVPLVDEARGHRVKKQHLCFWLRQSDSLNPKYAMCTLKGLTNR